MLLHPCLSTTKYVNSNSFTFEGNNVMVLWQRHWKHYSYDNVVRGCETVTTSVTQHHTIIAFEIVEILFGLLTYNQWQNCWDLILKWGNFRDQSNPHPSSSPPLPSKLGCLLFPTGSLNSSTTTYCMERVGDRKLYFLLFKLTEHQRGTF